MAFDDNLINLNYVLAGLYPTKEESYRIVDAAQLPRIHIAFRDTPIDNWYSILDQADKRGKVLNVIQAARRDWPEDPALQQAEKGELTTVRGPVIGKDLGWSTEQPGDTLEKLMEEQSTLLPISFLELGLECARSVARVKLAGGKLASGFLIKDNIFVTNHHVFHNAEEARTAKLQFNYQQSDDGLFLEVAEFELDPNAGFATSKGDDWSAVRVRGNANAEWGALDIQPLDITHTEWVNIIQHPGGGPKQIALYHNLVAFADDRRIQYLTDTLPGSSGSPVFDSHWRLTAVHHSGGWIHEPGTKKQVFRNEGITVNCLLAGLKQSGLIAA